MEYQSDQSLEELAAFVAVVEANGFRAAARLAQGRKATLSRRVQDLESRLGVSLLVRTTRSLRLTEEGRVYFDHATRALSSARDAEAAVLAAKGEPRGVLRITTSAAIAAPMLGAVIATYLSKYAEVRVQLDVSDRRLDVLREGYDVALWFGTLEDSSLITRRLGMGSGGFYASPQYVARRGAPQRPEDVAAHDTIAVPKGDVETEWSFVVGGKAKRIRIRPRMLVNDVQLATRAAAEGMGIVHAPVHLAAPYVETKKLVPVLREHTPPGVDVHALFPPGGALVPKTRAFVDLLDAWFAGNARKKRTAR